MALRVGQNYYDSGSASDDAMNAQRAAIAMIIAEQTLGLPPGTLSGVGARPPDPFIDQAPPGDPDTDAGTMGGPITGSGLFGGALTGFNSGTTMGAFDTAPSGNVMEGANIGHTAATVSGPPSTSTVNSDMVGAPATAPGLNTGALSAMTGIVGPMSANSVVAQGFNDMGYGAPTSPATPGHLAAFGHAFNAPGPLDAVAVNPGYSIANEPGAPAQQASQAPEGAPAPSPGEVAAAVADAVGMGFGGATGDGTSGGIAGGPGVGVGGASTGISGGPGGSGEGGANTGEGGTAGTGTGGDGGGGGGGAGK